MDHLKYFFVKFVNQNFQSVRITVFRETTKFLFTLEAQQFAYILLQKSVKNVFLHLDSTLAKIFGGFAPKHPMGELTALPNTP